MKVNIMNERRPIMAPYQHRHPRHQPIVQVQVGDHFPLTIRKMGVNGQGIGYFKHKVCFVPGTLTGEVVVAEVTNVHPRFLEAKIHRLRKASPNRVQPRDAYANTAGGFEFEIMNYPAQLRFKRQVVLDSLAKFKPLGYRHYQVKPTLPAEPQYGYRNKAQFQVRQQDGKLVMGLYAPNSHTVVDMPTCAVQMPGIMTVMNHVRQMISDLQIPVYDEEQNSGIIKTVVVRESMANGDIQLTFITNSPKLLKKHQLLVRIQDELPQVVSVLQNINPGATSTVWGPTTKLLAGQRTITESLMGLDFLLSAPSFLQLNPYQTENLYEETAKALDLSKNDTLIDAYAGVGTIGLSLASRVKEVLGMEIIPEAVEDANANAQLNGIDNARYEVGAAEDLLPKWQAEGHQFDALVVDPPRTGLDAHLIDAIFTAKPRKFAYVSCNMATMARNLARLAPTYRVDYIQPVDMMPQTPRCEAVVKLSLNK